jgi:hypothetical protein
VPLATSERLEHESVQTRASLLAGIRTTRQWPIVHRAGPNETADRQSPNGRPDSKWLRYPRPKKRQRRTRLSVRSRSSSWFNVRTSTRLCQYRIDTGSIDEDRVSVAPGDNPCTKPARKSSHACGENDCTQAPECQDEPADSAGLSLRYPGGAQFAAYPWLLAPRGERYLAFAMPSAACGDPSDF